MDGILIIDKPTGITSHKVIEIIRKKLKVKRVGHAGTLDPLATGLLIIMIGKATKLSNFLISQFKSYEVKMKLFRETDTGDVTGKVIKNEKVRMFTENQVWEAINSFNDYEYWQRPPIYSAIKIRGRKLYQYARQGIQVEVPARLVKIREIKLLNYSSEREEITFLVECSKGTYIRSLVKDIAEKLETIGTVSQLRRISSGNFHISQVIKLEEVKEEKIIMLEKVNYEKDTKLSMKEE